MRVPLEVGQIRDVANGTERRAGKKCLARVVKCSSAIYGDGRCRIAALDGKRERDKLAADLERCPVVDEQGRAVGEENAKPARSVEQVLDDLRKRAENAEAERDGLRLRVEALEAELRAVNDRLEGESVARLLAGGDL